MDKKIIAFVGMAGSGKSEATAYVTSKNIPSIRFGDITDEGLKKEGKEINAENERVFREELREKQGMAAYAQAALPKIEKALLENTLVAIDGLYSWEEYLFLKKKFPSLVLIHVYAVPPVRYERLAKRTIRPLTQEEAQKRDIMELSALNKGGPIAMADFVIDNTHDEIKTSHAKIDAILQQL